MSRPRLIAGILMLMLGAAALVMSARVLSTFLLEMVVSTIGPEPGSDIPPFEFSWGTMEWGSMARDFSMVAAGLVLIGIGQLLVLPVAFVRGGSKVQQGALVGAGVMALIAAASYFFVPSSAMQAFGMLAESGVADPVFMGEQMAVRVNSVFAGCLAVAQLLLISGILNLVAGVLPRRQGLIR